MPRAQARSRRRGIGARGIARRGGLTAAAVLAGIGGLFGLAGCASAVTPSSSPAPAPAAEPPPALTASVLQSRQDVVDGRLVVQVDNGTDEPLEIDRLVVSSPALGAEPSVDGPKLIAAGRSVQYRMDLPAPTCDDPGDVATVVFLEGRVGEASVAGDLATTDPYATIARVQNDGCLAAAVERIVGITPPERLRSTGAGADRRAVIDLAVAPVAGAEGTVSVRQVLGTTLLSAEDGLNWPVTLEIAGGGAPTTIELPVRPARCDQHAGAEDKRGTILPLEVVTSDGWSGLYEVRSGAALKQDLFAYFTERCGLG
ncbi:hypothetical protein GE115_12950 [Agromyces sp. CFH 90414]|uniref:Uncharacterized protein n=1 Tax=Agromyces agglutinans TaxID=2662258 RepID=A0A6I2FJ83_9MICO|nr:hypothetical protein [Agromyces agglutinans]MRG60768.1 hypothetical protein [Agromyces agglutinans]